jgi:hypothetical protein
LPIRIVIVTRTAYAATSMERGTKMAERAQVKGTEPTDATPSWIDGENRCSAAMPISDFRAYVAKGVIVLGT